ncbi:putative Ig domain-containing protein [Marinobacter lacisalsi]|uniref:Ig domain-containing protein n=1 Tax=Marinobacter lacisalsi TaxID=475979 RepID=A0ABV8QFJ9_9GAMM
MSGKRSGWATFVLLGSVLAMVSPGHAQDLLEVRDMHGRVVNNGEIDLVDWEGFIANPAIRVTVDPTQDVNLPASVTLTVNSASIVNQQFYFNCDNVVQAQCHNSDVGTGGPEKILNFSNRDAQSFFVSIWPDRDDRDENVTLSLAFGPNNQNETLNIPVHVIDQDRFARQSEFRIDIDFSRDEDGFDWFDRSRRVAVQQAVDDWAYFLDDMNLDGVPAGAQTTLAWPHKRGFHEHCGERRKSYQNDDAYTGFLLYAYGIRCEADGHICNPCNATNFNCNPPDSIRSGGAPMSDDPNQVQRRDGQKLKPLLWRSGVIDLEIDGNYDRGGWARVVSGPRWFQIDNRNINDLYSVFRHELGHALAFNRNYRGFKPGDSMSTPAVRRYYGRPVETNDDDHFFQAIDPASLHGAFGNEYHGRVPPRRWLITKLDLLLLEAVGYELRETTATAEFRITTNSLPQGRIGESYEAMLEARGGVPIYDWHQTSDLPQGLSVDRRTGRITGIPGSPGSFEVTAAVCDGSPVPGGRCTRKHVTLEVARLGGGDDGDDRGNCIEQCNTDRDQCMADDQLPASACVQVFRQCLELCR